MHEEAQKQEAPQLNSKLHAVRIKVLIDLF